VTGLSSVTVTQSGAGNNLTYTVVMTGVSGDPPQMTSTSSLTGGTPIITHATTLAYPGYNTLVVKLGDSSRYDPDANPYGTIWTCTVNAANIFNLLLTGTLENVTIRNGVLQHNWTNVYSTKFVDQPGGGATTPEMLTVLFENIVTEAAGLTANQNGTMRMWDFGTTGPNRCERVVFRNCWWLHPLRPATELMTDVRMDFTHGGDVRFENCVLPCWGTGPEFSNANGNVSVVGCRVQTNEAYYSANATTNAFTQTLERYTVGLHDSSVTSQPVVLEKRGYTLPGSTPQIAVGVVYWHRQSTGKLYPTKADADADTNAIDITTANGPVLFRFLNATLSTIRSTHKYLGDKTYPAAYAEMRDNLWRGSPIATYAQITADQNQFTLIPLLNHHRLSSDASRNINGIKAIGLGQILREDTIYNVGAQNIVLVNASGSASGVDQLSLPGAANKTIAAGNAVQLVYDPETLTRRMSATT